MAVFYIGTELYSAGTQSEDRRSSRYMFNRLLTSTVTDGVKTVLLADNHYDTGWGGFGSGAVTDIANLREHDASYGTTFLYWRNLTASFAPGNSVCRTYD